MKNILILRITSSFACYLLFQAELFAQQNTLHDLDGAVRLQYQNSGLKVDLGVGLWPWPLPMDFDLDGDMDLLVSSAGYYPYNGLYFFENASGDTIPVFKKPKRLGDGDEDLICGNTAGQIGFIENLDGGDHPKWNKPVLLEADGKVIRIMAGENGSIQGPCEQKWGYTTLSVADWDGDGLKDIVVNSILGKVVWFKNDGSKSLPKLTSKGPVIMDWGKQDISKPSWNWWNPTKNELVTQWRTTPCIIDWNKDGMTDLVILDHEGYLALFERFKKNGQLYLHPGQRIFLDAEKSRGNEPLRLNAGTAGQSGRRKLCLADWDNDGDIDLIANSPKR